MLIVIIGLTGLCAGLICAFFVRAWQGAFTPHVVPKQKIGQTTYNI